MSRHAPPAADLQSASVNRSGTDPRAFDLLCSFITCFVTLFATVIAITKDLPDIEGDQQFGIETFATRMGVR